MSDKKHCDCCNTDIRKQDFARHLGTKKHLANVGGDNTIVKPIVAPVVAPVVSSDETDNEDEDDDDDENENEGEPDDYLDEFSNINFKNAPVENTVKPPPVKPPVQLSLSSREKLQNLFQNKQRIESTLPSFIKRHDKDTNSVKSDDIFSNKNATKVVGKEIRVLLARVKQYKMIFPKELKTFKIKKNPTVQELTKYLDEMQAILDCQQQDSFFQQAVYQFLQISEGVSGRFPQYNLKGMTEMLRGNKEFNDLLKILTLKYGNSFSSVPPEGQMAFILVGTIYMCVSRNRLELQINEPYVLPIKVETPPQMV